MQRSIERSTVLCLCTSCTPVDRAVDRQPAACAVSRSFVFRSLCHLPLSHLSPLSLQTGKLWQWISIDLRGMKVARTALGFGCNSLITDIYHILWLYPALGRPAGHGDNCLPMQFNDCTSTRRYLDDVTACRNLLLRACSFGTIILLQIVSLLHSEDR